MPISPHNSKVIQELLEAGVIPANCMCWSMHSPAGGAVTMKMEVYVTQEQFEAIGRALMNNPDEARAMTEFIVYNRARNGALKV